MPKRYVNLLVVPEGNSRSIKLRLPVGVTWLLAGTIGFLLFFVIVMSILHGRLLYEVVMGKSLKQENERLRRYNARIVELEKELREYKKFVRRVAQLAGVEYPGQSEARLAYYTEGKASTEREAVLSFPGNISTFLDSFPEQSDSLRHIPRGMPIEGWVTQGFSMSTYGFGGEHPGVDFAARTGTEVKATADGKVVFVGWDDIYGNLVAIDHGNGYVTYYGHNSSILVRVGDIIRRGEVIALSGNTGRSSAPHLHYEIRKNEVPVDPEKFLSPNGE